MWSGSEEVVWESLSGRPGGGLRLSEEFVTGCGAHAGKSGSFSTQENTKKYFFIIEMRWI